MRSVEMEELVQVITDRVIAKLSYTKSSIIFRDQIKAYPTSYVQRLSADYQPIYGLKQGSNAALLCLSKINMKQIIAIAHLTSIDDLSNQVLEFVLNGKPVWIFKKNPELSQYRHQTRYAVWKELQNAFEKLDNYNIHFIYNNDTFDQQLKSLKSLNKIVKNNIKYITLSKLQERFKNHEVLLSNDERLTDLALEWAQEKRLEL